MAQTKPLIRQPPEPGATVVAEAARAPKKLTLRQNFSWMFCAQMISGVLRWGLLVILAKLGGPAMVGTWTLAQAISLPVMYLTQLNLKTVLVTDAAREHTVGEYLFLRLVTNILQMMIVVGVCLWQQLDAYTTVCVVLFSVSVAALSFRQMLLAVPIRNENTRVNARSQLIVSLATFAAVALVLWTTGSLVWVMISIVGVRMAVVLMHDFPAALVSEKHYCPEAVQTFRPRYAPSMLRLAWTALPAGLSVAALSYANNVPLYYLEAHHGREAMGYFGGLYAFVAAVNIVLTPLFASVGPRLAKYFAARRRRDFLRLVGKVVLVFLAGGVVLVVVCRLWGGWILRWALSERFHHLWREFAWTMALASIWSIYAFLSHVLQTTRHFWVTFGLQIVMLGLTTCLSHVLVPDYGVWGVIYARLGVTLFGVVGAAALTVGLLSRRSRVQAT
ncbi:MAG: lipopolysaccharide biosynthesis protein [Planctomycetota bacterium]